MWPLQIQEMFRDPTASNQRLDLRYKYFPNRSKKQTTVYAWIALALSVWGDDRWTQKEPEKKGHNMTWNYTKELIVSDMLLDILRNYMSFDHCEIWVRMFLDA